MKHYFKHTRTIALLILILSVAISSFYCFSSGTSQKESHKKEVARKKTNKKEEQVSTCQSILAVVPFINVDLIKDFYLVATFEFAEKRIPYFNNSALPYTIKYFKTLFCFVISTNAP